LRISGSSSMTKMVGIRPFSRGWCRLSSTIGDFRPSPHGQRGSAVSPYRPEAPRARGLRTARFGRATQRPTGVLRPQRCHFHASPSFLERRFLSSTGQVFQVSDWELCRRRAVPA
jgi:hypothetical protein